MFRIFFLNKMIVFLSVFFMSINAVSKSLYMIADISFHESTAPTNSDNTPPCNHESNPVYIYPSTDSLLFAGDEFWLNICVGDSINPVRQLYGTSFILVYDTSFVKIVSPFDSIVPGDFLGLKHNVKHFAHFLDSLSVDSLGLAVTRIESDSAVSGWGCILSVKFMIKSSIPDTEICFYITDITANDNNWNPVILTPRDSCFAVRGNLNVWPGDTDNNGIVDQADMLPIGLSWGVEGPSRDYSNLSEWEGQMCRPWMQGDRYTYADAYGDGLVDELDVSVICINWHCRQEEGCTADVCKSLAVAGKGGTIQAVVLDKISDEIIDVELLIEDVENILGMSIKFQYPTDKVEVVTVLQGDYWGETPIFLYKNDSYNGIVGIGTGRIRPQGGVSGSGCVARIRLRSESETALYQLGFGRVVGVDLLGNILDFEVINEIQKEIKKSTTFLLYQNYPNPFNISTVIRYELPEMSRVTVKVYDLLGTEVKTLVDNIKEAGSYSVIWDGKNKNYERVSSGIYCFSIKAGEFSAVRKGLLLK